MAEYLMPPEFLYECFHDRSQVEAKLCVGVNLAVSPCAFLDGDVWPVNEPSEAEFWAVYVGYRETEGCPHVYSIAVVDCTTRKLAMAWAHQLQTTWNIPVIGIEVV